LVFRQRELVFWTLETKAAERKAKGVVRGFEYGACASRRFEHVSTHPYILGTLPREQQCEHRSLFLLGLNNGATAVLAAVRADAVRLAGGPAVGTRASALQHECVVAASFVAL
jgi:hypothetical protein